VPGKGGQRFKFYSVLLSKNYLPVMVTVWPDSEGCDSLIFCCLQLELKKSLDVVREEQLFEVKKLKLTVRTCTKFVLFWTRFWGDIAG
jgi:hypothetical protein